MCWPCPSREHSLTMMPLVASVSAPHFAFSPGSRSSARGGLLRVALPAPGFLRPRPRDSPSHGRRVRSGRRGRDDERRGQQQHPSVGHRIFRPFRRRARCGRGMCAQDGNGALAASVRHRRRPQNIVRSTSLRSSPAFATPNEILIFNFPILR